jgi:hypothetical protein
MTEGAWPDRGRDRGSMACLGHVQGWREGGALMGQMVTACWLILIGLRGGLDVINTVLR